LTGVADTRILFFMEVPATPEMGRKTRDFFEKELRENLLVPTVVLAEFIEIAGARIGEATAKTRIRVLEERGMQIMQFDERHAMKTGSLLLSNRKVPLADAIIASYVKTGEADYVVTDDPHFKMLNVKTRWIP
jgi:predicted nucleic acid-binding protein